MSQDLTQIRQHISQLDRSLLKLLAERRQLALDVARSKEKSLTALRDTEREQILLSALIQQAHELQLDPHYVTQIYHTIIEDSVLTQQAYLQQQLNPAQTQQHKIAFLGMRGSYSHLAARKYAARHTGRLVEISCRTFDEILKQVEQGQADYGVLPIENTSSGSINDVYDLLQHTQLSIVGELTHPIEHCLLVAQETSADQIHTVYSHPQPLQQCSQFLATLGQVQLEFCESSSHAMQKVAQLQSPHVAAISNAEGGELYGLHALQGNIANQQENISRFIVVAREPVEVAAQVSAKTTLIMSTAQHAGSLVEALLILRDHGINMSKLESRPINGRPWEEMFYLDVEGNLSEARMQSALRLLSRQTRYVKVLGCYPSETVIPTEIPPEAHIPHSREAMHLSAQPILGHSVESRERGTSTKNTHDLDAAPCRSVRIGAVTLGGQQPFRVFAGPTHGASREALLQSAATVKQFGGALFSLPLTLAEEAQANSGAQQALTDLLRDISRRYQLPLLLPVTTTTHLTTLAAKADLLYIPPQAMHNTALLHAAGKTPCPVMLSRAPDMDNAALLAAANTVRSQGNQQVILCETGSLRTTESAPSWDLVTTAQLCQQADMPVVVAPSVFASDTRLLPTLVQAARSAGAHGVLLPLALPGDASITAETDSTAALDALAFGELMQTLR